MSPLRTTSPRSQLLDVKRLYEEQEEKWKQRVAEKDDLIAQLEADVQERDRQLQSRSSRGGGRGRGAADPGGGRAGPPGDEREGRAAQRADPELNQRLLAATGARAAPCADYAGRGLLQG